MALRCVNCSLRIARIRRHRLSEESDEILERVRRWVYPRDISGADYVCHACWEIMNRNYEQQPVHASGHHSVCLTCGRSILRVRSRMVLRDERSEREILFRDIVSEWIHPRQLQPSDEVCIPCWLRAQRAANSRSQQNQPVEASAGPSNAPNVYQEPQHEEAPVQHEIIEAEPISVASITLPTLRRAADTARRCLFSECDDREKRVVPHTIRKQVILDYNFYIPINSRICDHHLESNSYHELYAADNALSMFTADMIEEIIFLLKDNNPLDFSQPENIDDHLFKYWFGRTKTEYSAILTEVPRLNTLKMKLGLNALLCKMRTGDSDERISALFQTPRRTLESYIEQARDILLQDYVPRHLGLDHVSREEVVARNSYLANHLFGNPEEPVQNRNLITIVDGTYLNIQKSSNYAFQKNTYSLHKYRNLVKPFLIVCCDGYIIEALGPYPATKNDAEIMKEFIENDLLLNIFKEDDIFILDRGFRDCRDDLFQKGTLTVEEVYKDRDQFAGLVREVAAPDVGRMGIEILSFTIKDVYDDVQYLASLGKAQTAAVKRDADIGVAQANRDAGIQEAECEKTAMDVKYSMDTKIEDNARMYKLQKAQFDQEVNTAKAESALAYELQAAKIKQKIRNEEIMIEVVERRKQIEVEQQEIMRREEELIATVRLPAEAEAYRLQTIAEGKRTQTVEAAKADGERIKVLGLAEAHAIGDVGKADAERMLAKAKVYKQYGDAALMALVLEALPKIAAEISAPLAKTDEIVLVGDNGATGEVARLAGGIPPAVRTLTGLDLTQVLKRLHPSEDLSSANLKKKEVTAC